MNSLRRIPTPLPMHFTWASRPRLYGVFAWPEQISVLREALGTPRTNLHVLRGPGGVALLDSIGMRGGLLARLHRFLQGMTDERSEITLYRQALEQGLLVVLVDMPRDDAVTKARLRWAFQQAGASSVHYYGRFVNEALTI